MSAIDEAVIEALLLDDLGRLGWTMVHGAGISAGQSAAERSDYREVVLTGRLRSAVARLNPDLPPDAWDDV